MSSVHWWRQTSRDRWVGVSSIFSPIEQNLPAREIAGTAKEVSAKAIALSLVYPLPDGRTVADLRELRRLAGKPPAILVGAVRHPAMRRFFMISAQSVSMT
jgi:hypothetical protein